MFQRWFAVAAPNNSEVSLSEAPSEVRVMIDSYQVLSTCSVQGSVLATSTCIHILNAQHALKVGVIPVSLGISLKILHCHCHPPFPLSVSVHIRFGSKDLHLVSKISSPQNKSSSSHLNILTRRCHRHRNSSKIHHHNEA